MCTLHYDLGLSSSKGPFDPPELTSVQTPEPRITRDFPLPPPSQSYRLPSGPVFTCKFLTRLTFSSVIFLLISFGSVHPQDPRSFFKVDGFFHTGAQSTTISLHDAPDSSLLCRSVDLNVCVVGLKSPVSYTGSGSLLRSFTSSPPLSPSHSGGLPHPPPFQSPRFEKLSDFF